jgi:colanic acid biosynthesis glycosyl transferase WcaI
MSIDTRSAPGRSGTSALRRWLVLTQYYPPEIGAPQIRLRCFVRELRRHGKDVSVTTAMPNYPQGRIFDNYRGRFSCREQIDEVPVRRIWVYAATGKAALARFLNYVSFAVTALPLILFGRRPDVIFVEAQPLPLGIVALLMKALRGVPYIYNVPDLQVDVARELGFLRWAFLLRIAVRVENLLLMNAMTVSTVTHSFMEHFEARGVPRNRITFLPNGADTTFLHPSEPSIELIEKWQLKGKMAFVYVGTHAYYHGLDTLVRAAELLRTDQRIKIVMVGDGPERERIRNLALEKGLENIVFARVPYEGSNDLYSVAYASVATLRNVPVAQGMRLSKIFPALSCGVPVIYSGEGEAAELLAHHRCGVTVAPEDASALAEAISKLARDPGMRHELGKNGRSLVQHEYSWSTIVDRWLQQMEYPDIKVPSAVEQSDSKALSADTTVLGDGMLAGVAPHVRTGAEQ